MEGSSLERARMDVEMLLAAYPDEISGSSANDAEFPVRVRLQLSNDAHVNLEFQDGYPTTLGVQISSYRSKPHEKERMEAAVTAIRETAQQCRQMKWREDCLVVLRQSRPGIIAEIKNRHSQWLMMHEFPTSHRRVR